MAGAAVAAPAPVPAVPQAADCAPPKKKVAHHQHDKDADEKHAQATPNDEDQNLSQAADGCVLPQTGQAAPAPQEGAAPVGEPMAAGGGGINSGLLIGAGVLAAVGVGVLALAKGDKDEPNVAPTANPDTGAVNEGSVLTGSVRTNDTDPNSRDTLTYTISGTAPAGLTLNSDGTYSFDANNAAYNALAAGATQVVTANYNVSDGRGGTATSTLTITITGTNDNPVAVADTGPASTEGGAAVTGSVATNDSDPDTGAVLTYALVSPVAGLTLNANGTYSFNPADAAYNSLAAGQQQTVVANYRVSDAQGGSATSTLTLVITGTNDAPVAVADVGAVNEGATLTGSVATNDSDPDQNAVLTYTLNAPVTGLTLNANGTYSFDANNAAYNSLAVGQTQVVVANYTVTDGQGATSTSTLTITITGTNDAPVAVAAVNAAIENGAVVSGQLVGTDVDQGAVLTYSLNAPVAGLTVNSNGTYSFDPSNPAYNSLAAGQTQAVVANFTVTDAQGATSTSTLTITVTGTNDVPTVVSDTAAVNEDATVTGNLRTNDSDPDTTDTLTYTVVGTAPAGLTVNANGTYSFNAANAAYQSLAAGQTQVVTATIAVTDGTSPAINETLTITITGTNDAPVAVAAVAAATENGAVVTGQVTGTDVDQGAVLTYSLNSPVAGLTLNADGTYSFDPSNPAYNSIAAGQTQAVVANFTVTDAQGATSTSTLTITVTGTNDGPTAAADVAAVNEGAVVTGSVATNDVDPDTGDTLTYSLNAPVAGLTLNANGGFSFDANNAAYNSLAAGQTQVVVANYTVTDPSGATSTSTLTITVTGTNDAPVAVADVAAATEGGSAVTGSVATNDSDPDQGATLTYSLNNAVAGLTFNADGSYSFDPTNAAYNSLAAGQTLAVVANYTVSDGLGGTATSNLTITVTGTNDAPVATAATNAAIEDTVISGTLTGNASDPDGDSLIYSVQGGVPAGFTLLTNGSYTFDTTVASYQQLTAGQTQDVVVTYRVQDPTGGTSTSTLTIRVTGVVEQANLDTDDDGNLNTARFFEAGLTDFIFTDDDVVANNVIVNRLGADDVIFFDGDVGSYSFTSGDFDGDLVADDILIQSTVNGAMSTVVLSNVIADGTSITNEAQAEAAIGPAADNFRFVVTQSLDVDSDSNLNTAQVFDAGTGSFRFVDDADVANTASVINFGANDRIVLEAGITYSYTNGNYDGVGGGNDLLITYNKPGGTVSTLYVMNAVASNARTFDDATVETALNNFFGTTGVDYIQFA